ncbi:Hypothetical Protein FCC1311_019232 [Hondaea fermentalgiana]|uniref:C2HC zinc finger plants domain-containing protein n=1 Tax=Hondaea fermentalgiana TaxID=2315210 RepID=A0A2R5GD46_9STRA|nr:Hypothetical Protein FCC1311_019232 [Hondaea fermentalgiana]|eukprot:GBG25704.1 Hypothetical Protein FCC1311_019232 [Hondaea fermentalgiana]
MQGIEDVEALVEALEALSVDDPRRQTLLQGQPAALVQEALKILDGRSSVLRDRGQADILRDAAKDGSSFMCTRCEGLIAISRMEFHQEWCPAAPQPRDQAAAMPSFSAGGAPMDLE